MRREQCRDLVRDFAGPEADRPNLLRKTLTCFPVKQHTPEQGRQRLRASREERGNNSGKNIAPHPLCSIVNRVNFAEGLRVTLARKPRRHWELWELSPPRNARELDRSAMNGASQGMKRATFWLVVVAC